MIEVNTATFVNKSGVENFLTGVSLSIDISKINSSQNKTKNKIWLLRFNYNYLLSVNIHIYTTVFFWCSEITEKIYLSIHLDEYSNNAVEGPYFKIKINNIFLVKCIKIYNIYKKYVL